MCNRVRVGSNLRRVILSGSGVHAVRGRATLGHVIEGVVCVFVEKRRFVFGGDDPLGHQVVNMATLKPIDHQLNAFSVVR